jgi:hypothetical protein
MHEIMQKIKPEEQKHFFMTYSSYNMIGTVKMVRTDVGNAIADCGKNNPEMKEKLDARFKTWNEAVDPVMKEAEAHIENMVLAQDYAKKEDILDIYKTVDEAREKSNKRIDKVPVTTPEACQFLLEKMDETQENMISLLRTTLVTFPQAFPDAAAAVEKDVEAPADAPPAEDEKPEAP